MRTQAFAMGIAVGFALVAAVAIWLPTVGLGTPVHYPAGIRG